MNFLGGAQLHPPSKQENMISKIFPIILGIAIVVLVIIGVFYFYPNTLSLPDNNNKIADNDQNSVLVAGAGLPVRLVIPGIEVNAPVIRVGLTSSGAVDVPKGPSEVAWYQLGPRPGAEGSSVITGHFGPWRDGSRSVFDNLNQLKLGDTVQVKDDKGVTLTFKVRETKMYNANEAPTEVFTKTGGAYLNLITCQGDWLSGQRTYTQRLVVFTELVE